MSRLRYIEHENFAQAARTPSVLDVADASATLPVSPPGIAAMTAVLWVLSTMRVSEAAVQYPRFGRSQRSTSSKVMCLRSW